MKRFFALICFGFACILLTVPASAHSGRTDGNGGHYNGSSYHYHHGYPAHQHINGVCPYNFDDQTGAASGNSGDGSNGGGGDPFVSHESKEPSSQRDWTDLAVILVLVSPAIIYYIFLILADACRKKAEQRKQKRRFKEERGKYTSLYAGKTLAELSGMPANVEIGADGLPKTAGADGWGNEFTFYISRAGTAYHRKPTCTKGADVKIHACSIGARKPCARCRPQAPNLVWFPKYQQIQKVCEQYHIELVGPEQEPEAKM